MKKKSVKRVRTQRHPEGNRARDHKGNRLDGQGRAVTERKSKPAPAPVPDGGNQEKTS